MPELNLGKVVGPQGPQGATGPTGAEGKQGPPGATGEAGKSAYQAAKDGGYTGTEAEFNAVIAVIDRHSRRHRMDGADPLTPMDIGALQHYYGLTDIGLTMGSETIDGIVSAMSNYSDLAFSVGATHATIYPFQHGICYVYKHDYTRVHFTFRSHHGDELWYGKYYYTSDPKFSGWIKVATTDYVAQNAAPAGYGLGNVLAATMPGGDLNNAISNGWFAVSESSLNRPSAVKYGVLSVASRKNGETHQTLYGVGNTTDFIFDGTILRRYLTYKGTWSAWEWENPPMELGKEYRTTERYGGKPVYVQLREGGSLAIGSGSSPSNSHIEGFSNRTLDVVRSEAYIVPINITGTQYKNTLIDDSGNVLCATKVRILEHTNPDDAWSFCTFRCFADMSAYKGRVYLWYTKNTDEG